MVSSSKEGVISHRYGCYLREGSNTSTRRLFRVMKGQIGQLKESMEQSGFGYLIPDPDSVHGLNGTPVLFVPLDKIDGLGTPYATNLSLDTKRVIRLSRY